MKSKKTVIDEMTEALEKMQEEFSQIEEAILMLGKDKDWDPEVFVPAVMYLYATGSKELNMPFEKALKFAAESIAHVYEVKLVDVMGGEEDGEEEDSPATSKHMH
jgi:hypothetical protein